MLKLQSDFPLLTIGYGLIRNQGDEPCRLCHQLVFAGVDAAYDEVSLCIARGLSHHAAGGIKQFQMRSGYWNALGIKNSSGNSARFRNGRNIEREDKKQGKDRECQAQMSESI